MEEFKGSPGPWVVVNEHPTPTIISVESTNDHPNWMALTLFNAKDGETQIANANLIAAAPELFEALKGLVVFIQSNGISIPADVSTAPIGIAKAAINKALGKEATNA